ncbi:MAG TPA: phage holin family protein, partial [Opitutaceae bacterium]
MSSDHPNGPGGLVDALRNLGDNLIAGVEERMRLLSLELQEEKFRLVQTLIWISASMITTVLALAFISLALVYAFGEEARLLVIGVLALVYSAACLTCVWLLRRLLLRQPRPF